jgi:hypothetical protein
MALAHLNDLGLPHAGNGRRRADLFDLTSGAVRWITVCRLEDGAPLQRQACAHGSRRPTDPFLICAGTARQSLSNRSLEACLNTLVSQSGFFSPLGFSGPPRVIP